MALKYSTNVAQLHVIAKFTAIVKHTGILAYEWGQYHFASKQYNTTILVDWKRHRESCCSQELIIPFEYDIISKDWKRHRKNCRSQGLIIFLGPDVISVDWERNRKTCRSQELIISFKYDIISEEDERHRKTCR